MEAKIYWCGECAQFFIVREYRSGAYGIWPIDFPMWPPIAVVAADDTICVECASHGKIVEMRLHVEHAILTDSNHWISIPPSDPPIQPGWAGIYSTN